METIVYTLDDNNVVTPFGIIYIRKNVEEKLFQALSNNYGAIRIGPISYASPVRCTADIYNAYSNAIDIQMNMLQFRLVISQRNFQNQIALEIYLHGSNLTKKLKMSGQEGKQCLLSTIRKAVYHN